MAARPTSSALTTSVTTMKVRLGTLSAMTEPIGPARAIATNRAAVNAPTAAAPPSVKAHTVSAVA